MIRSPAGFDGGDRIKRYLDYYQPSYGVMMLSTSQFSPAVLFAAGEQGAWYDPSDFSTMFQDSAGTTPVTAVEQPVGRILDKSGRGNHATQATAGNRPVLSARVNELLYSEALNNAVWAPINVVVVPPTQVSADEVSFPAATTAADISLLRQVFTSVAAEYIGSIELKAKAAGDVGKQIAVYINDGSTVNVTFYTLTNDWVRVTVTETTSATALCYFSIGVLGSAYGGVNQAAFSVNIKNADARVANTGVGIPTYQRVTTATDYDATGFPYYLRFDGTNDGLATGTITPGTDKIQVFSGVRKSSDTLRGMVAELGDGTVSAAMQLNAPGTNATADYIFRAGGGAVLTVTATGFAAPLTSVVTGLSDIAGDSLTIRVNGTVAATNTADQGAGNFGNYPIYIGRRAGTSLPLNGNLYSLIIRFGANLAASTITSTETWVNGKTGAY